MMLLPQLPGKKASLSVALTATAWPSWCRRESKAVCPTAGPWRRWSISSSAAYAQGWATAAPKLFRSCSRKPSSSASAALACVRVTCMMFSSRARLPITGLNKQAHLSSSVLSSRIAVPRARKLLLWAPTLVWLCVLGSFSTNTFSAAHTGIILRKIVGFIYPGITPHQFEVLHFLVRKSAHFVSYGLLSLFAFLSWRATLPTGDPSHPSKPKPGLPGTPRWNSRWMRLALLLTLLAASLDEIHQTFIYSRTGSVRDVLLDMTGALFFQLAIWLVLRREKRA